MLCAQSPQSCLTLCDRMDYRPPDSSVHVLLQERILGWVAMPSSRGSSRPRIEPMSPVSPEFQVDSLPLSLYGSPTLYYML